MVGNVVWGVGVGVDEFVVVLVVLVGLVVR